MKAQALAMAILAAIKRGEINEDTDIEMAEEIVPGQHRFIGDVTRIMTLPGMSTLYLVNSVQPGEDVPHDEDFVEEDDDD